MLQFVNRTTLKTPYARAFNGAIALYACPQGACPQGEGGYLCVFRQTEALSRLCRLDAEFRIVSPAWGQACVPFALACPQGGRNLVTDPRIVQVGDDWLLSYSTGLGMMPNGAWDEWVEICKFDPATLKPDYASRRPMMTVRNMPGYTQRREKNWTPFEYESRLWYLYERPNHTILHWSPEYLTVEFTGMQRAVDFGGDMPRGDSLAVRVASPQGGERYFVTYQHCDGGPALPHRLLLLQRLSAVRAAHQARAADRLARIRAAGARAQDGPARAAYGLLPVLGVRRRPFDRLRAGREPRAVGRRERLVHGLFDLQDCRPGGGGRADPRRQLHRVASRLRGRHHTAERLAADPAVLSRAADSGQPFAKVFEGVPGIRHTGVEQLLEIYGPDELQRHGIYGWMAQEKWGGSMEEAYVAMYTRGRERTDGRGARGEERNGKNELSTSNVQHSTWTPDGPTQQLRRGGAGNQIPAQGLRRSSKAPAKS